MATIIMILRVSLLAEKGFIRVFAAFAFVFGLWDTAYYFWLKLMIAWPRNWWEWDVLFLLPWPWFRPWFRPWFTPALVALLMVIWSNWILSMTTIARFSIITGILFILDTFMGLATFIWPALPLLFKGEKAFQNYRPAAFMWGLFFIGYLLMVISLWSVAKKLI